MDEKALRNSLDPLAWHALADLLEERCDLQEAALYRRQAAWAEKLFPLWAEMACCQQTTPKEKEILLEESDPTTLARVRRGEKILSTRFCFRDFFVHRLMIAMVLPDPGLFVRDGTVDQVAKGRVVAKLKRMIERWKCFTKK